MKSSECECSDKGCSVHEGKAKCYEYARELLMRIDMEDTTGTWMCENCADDAMSAGVFRRGDIGEEIKNRR